uniref:Uncharacterized protein n=1 Tax=Trichobilharzia regenti TaxID=157069 RepID=A0AA85IYM6_TRIRE|nr:unnamed protein product [Trichobilharzia regenti]
MPVYIKFPGRLSMTYIGVFFFLKIPSIFPLCVALKCCQRTLSYDLIISKDTPNRQTLSTDIDFNSKTKLMTRNCIFRLLKTNILYEVYKQMFLQGIYYTFNRILSSSSNLHTIKLPTASSYPLMVTKAI